MKKSVYLSLICVTVFIYAHSQNLIPDGGISNNANWNGQEAPLNATTYQSSYMAACGTNYVMEADAASVPTQTVTGFNSLTSYVLSFRYTYRSSGCGPSNNPTFLRIRFTDATVVLDYTLSIPNTQITFATFNYTFTNNSATTHTIEFSNPGNVNTCGVIVDDISLIKISSPGGIGTTNISYWIKASSIGLPDNSSVYDWLSQGNNVLTVAAPCGNPPVYKTGLASTANNFVANFNPYLTFNGSNQYLEYTGSRVDFMETSAGGIGGSFFSAYAGGTSNLSYFGHRSSTNDRLFGKTDSTIFAFNTAIGTNNITHTGIELNEISKKLADGAASQYQGALETASSIEQISASIKLTSDNAKNTEIIYKKVVSDLNKGYDAVDHTLEQMKQINDKVRILNELSSQTNILALNAAVEAARAGIHGKGFSVIASEVRKLAEKSASGANEITELTQTSLMIASDARNILFELLPDIQRTVKLINEIATTNAEQEQGINQINSIAGSNHQVIRESTTMSEHMSKSASELLKQAELLRGQLSFFQIKRKFL